MSGYHHNEGGCASCYSGQSSYDYATEYGTNSTDQCLPKCMDRFESERSGRDQSDYQFYVLREKPQERLRAMPSMPKSTLPGQVENFRQK